MFSAVAEAREIASRAVQARLKEKKKEEEE